MISNILIGYIAMENLISGILPEAYELFRKVIGESDDGKPHQLAARAAFRASVAADGMSDDFKYGKIKPHDAEKVRDAYKSAYDSHMDAAKKLKASGQISTAQSHLGIAQKSAKAAAHYDTMHKAHAGSEPKAANESVDYLPSPLLGAGQRKSPLSAKDHLIKAGIVITEEALPWWLRGLDKE